MKRLVILLHRYLGIALCLMVAAWCLSGAVMMYVPFPSLSSEQRVASLEPLTMPACCRFDAMLTTLRNVSLDRFEIEMLAGKPILRLLGENKVWLIDLRSGELLRPLDKSLVLQIATSYQQQHDVIGTPQLLDVIDHDQWTVAGSYKKYAPLYKVATGDATGTQLYIASNTAQIVQHTTRKDRACNYLGAVTHWLYFTPLRQHAGAWSQTVIWLSAFGVLLVMAGIYIGFAQLRSQRAMLDWSPYTGVNYWHHVSGMIFGVLALAWIGSGLLSMNPWGLLQSDAESRSARLNQVRMSAQEVVDIVAQLEQSDILNNALNTQRVLQLSSQVLGGNVFLIVTSLDTKQHLIQRQRLDASTLVTAPLKLPEVLQALSNETLEVSAAALLTTGDHYYYDDHARSVKPAYRVTLKDAEQSVYYIDALSGEVLLSIDQAARGYRWLFSAVPRWDFSPSLRQHPWWDLLVATLLIGVACCSITGVMLGMRRVTRWR